MTKAKPAPPLKATVTYLELSGAPRGQVTLPVNVQAALMRAPRLPLHYYRYLQDRVGRDYHWVHRLRMDDAALADIVHDPKTQIDVLYVDGAPAGFFELFRKDETTVDLVYFGMMAHAHGRGLGRWFLRQAIDTALAKDAARLTVNTCTLDHQAALPLYQKLGFTPTGQSETFIHPLSDDERARLATQA